MAVTSRTSQEKNRYTHRPSGVIMIPSWSCHALFRVAPPLELKKLEAIFRHKVFCMLIARGEISGEMIAMVSTCRHSGSNVFCGNRIQPKEKEEMGTLAQYIIQASFSQEWMQYLADEETVIYSEKDSKNRKGFDAQEWLAAMCSPIPCRGKQMVPVLQVCIAARDFSTIGNHRVN